VGLATGVWGVMVGLFIGNPAPWTDVAVLFACAAIVVCALLVAWALVQDRPDTLHGDALVDRARKAWF
jgi:hypothetical protein